MNFRKGSSIVSNVISTFFVTCRSELLLLRVSASDHHALWEKDMWHCDPSLYNFMVDKVTGAGVLLDWDHSLDEGPSSGHAGTKPYMPLDFLTYEFLEGEVERLYRHEMEGFIWVLGVACLTYSGGREVPDLMETEVSEFFYGSYPRVQTAKVSFLQKIRRYEIRGHPSSLATFFVARSLLKWLSDSDNARSNVPEESESGDINQRHATTEWAYDGWWECIREAANEMAANPAGVLSCVIPTDQKRLASVPVDAHESIKNMGKFIQEYMERRSIPKPIEGN